MGDHGTGGAGGAFGGGFGGGPSARSSVLTVTPLDVASLCPNLGTTVVGKYASPGRPVDDDEVAPACVARCNAAFALASLAMIAEGMLWLAGIRFWWSSGLG